MGKGKVWRKCLVMERGRTVSSGGNGRGEISIEGCEVSMVEVVYRGGATKV